MEISVVVAVKNEARYIKRCIEALLEQDYPKDQYEIIIVDGMSSDGTGTILKEQKKIHPNLKIFQNPKGNAAAGRNIGIKNSQGDYIAFIDSDAIARKNWLKKIKEVFATTDAIGVGGPDILPPDSIPKSKAIGTIMSSPLASGGGFNPSVQHIMSSRESYVEHIPTCNLCVKKEIFEKIGYFDEEFVKGQDLEFNTRLIMAGYKLFHSPKIKVYHYRKMHIHSFSRQIFKWAKAKAAITKKHGLVNPAYLLPLFGIIGMAILFLGALILNAIIPYLVFFFLGCTIYIFVITSESLRLSVTKKNYILFPYGLLLYPLIHLSYTFGIIYGVFKKKIW